MEAPGTPDMFLDDVPLCMKRGLVSYEQDVPLEAKQKASKSEKNPEKKPEEEPEKKPEEEPEKKPEEEARGRACMEALMLSGELWLSPQHKRQP